MYIVYMYMYVYMYVCIYTGDCKVYRFRFDSKKTEQMQ